MRFRPDIHRILLVSVLATTFPAVVLAQESTADICPLTFSAGYDGGMLLRGLQSQSAPFVFPEAVRHSMFRPSPSLFSGHQFHASAPASVFLHDPNDPAPIDVQLERLDGNGTFLEGEFSRVGSEKLDPDGAIAPGRDGLADYLFEPNLAEDENCLNDAADCSRFDAANVYFHVDRFAHAFWEERLGVDIDFRAEIRIHVPVGEGGLANPSTNRIYLSSGDIFTRNSALEDDLIYHEYTHLVMASLGFVVVPDNEQASALNEAFADYFAASYTDNPRLGAWVVTCPPSLDCPRDRSNDTDLRRLDLDPEVWNWNDGDPSPDLKYGYCLRKHLGDGKCKESYNNFQNAYVWGMIWGGAMWRLRTELGANVTDVLAVEALPLFEPYVSLSRALDHLLTVDLVQFGGAHEATILSVFEERGILPYTFDAVESDVPAEWSVRIWPNPASVEVRGVFTRPGSAPAVLSLYDVSGRLAAQRRLDAGEMVFSLDVSRYSPGVYGLRIVSGSHAVFRTIVVTR